MKEAKNYVQNDVYRCAAKARPEYCEFSGNPCCFSCAKNTDCMELALRKKVMKPCRANIPVIMKNGTIEIVSLFDEVERCEFSL